MRKLIIVSIALCGIVTSGCHNPYAKFNDPVNLGPNINTNGHEGSPDISSDGMTLYFDARRPGGSGGWDIWMAQAEAPHRDFSAATPLPAPVNSKFNESGPCLSDDGLKLYFASDRPGGSGNFDIWVATRATVDAPWTNPENLGPTVNSSAYDNHPSLSPDGLKLYFDSGRPNIESRYGFTDIYMCSRETIDGDWGLPEPLAINTEGIEYSPDISSDNLTLFYDSPLAGRDLWMAKRTTETDSWREGANMGIPFNTSGIDTDPSISANSPLLYFVSNRPGGNGGFDIWVVNSDIFQE